MNDALERFARDFPADTVLFEEGQPGHVMYIVVAGEIEIRRRVSGVERMLAVLGDGEFFGEMAILSGRPRSATAVARSAARLLVIDGTTFEAMLRARPEIALRLIKALAARLDATNHHVELLLLPTANHRVIQCLRRMAEEQIELAGSQTGPELAHTAIFANPGPGVTGIIRPEDAAIFCFYDCVDSIGFCAGHSHTNLTNNALRQAAIAGYLCPMIATVC